MPNTEKPTDAEFETARHWLELWQLDNPGKPLPPKINRKKNKEVRDGQFKEVGDIDTQHSFLVYKKKGGGFMLAGIDRSPLGTGATTTARKIFWEDGRVSKVSKLKNDLPRAAHILVMADHLYGVHPELDNRLLQRYAPPIFNGTEFFKPGGSTQYVEQPYTEGPSLKKFLGSKEELTPEQVIKLAIACTDALIEFHQGGLVHGDIHWDNLIIQVNGDNFLAKIIDLDKSSKASAETSLDNAKSGGMYDDISDLGTRVFTILDGKCKQQSITFEDLFINMAINPSCTLAEVKQQLQVILASKDFRYGEKTDYGFLYVKKIQGDLGSFVNNPERVKLYTQYEKEKEATMHKLLGMEDQTSQEAQKLREICLQNFNEYLQNRKINPQP